MAVLHVLSHYTGSIEKSGTIRGLALHFFLLVVGRPHVHDFIPQIRKCHPTCYISSVSRGIGTGPQILFLHLMLILTSLIYYSLLIIVQTRMFPRKVFSHFHTASVYFLAGEERTGETNFVVELPYMHQSPLSRLIFHLAFAFDNLSCFLIIFIFLNCTLIFVKICFELFTFIWRPIRSDFWVMDWLHEPVGHWCGLSWEM